MRKYTKRMNIKLKRKEIRLRLLAYILSPRPIHLISITANNSAENFICKEKWNKNGWKHIRTDDYRTFISVLFFLQGIFRMIKSIKLRQDFGMTIFWSRNFKEFDKWRVICFKPMKKFYLLMFPHLFNWFLLLI